MRMRLFSAIAATAALLSFGVTAASANELTAGWVEDLKADGGPPAWVEDVKTDGGPPPWVKTGAPEDGTDAAAAAPDDGTGSAGTPEQANVPAWVAEVTANG